MNASTLPAAILLAICLYAADEAFTQGPPSISTNSQTTVASGDATPDVESSQLTFDELLTVENRQSFQYRQFPVDAYRFKHGLQMGTCDLVGAPTVGKTVQLTNPVASFGILCGRDQPFISPHCVLIAAGGRTYDLLLTFETPITSASIVSDNSPETPDVIRLLIVEPLEADKRQADLEKNASRQVEVRVVARDEKQDDPISAPDNTLFVDLKGKPFHHVVIECTAEQEAFDDLRFTRLTNLPTYDNGRASPLFDWSAYPNIYRSLQPNKFINNKDIEKGTGR
jgi:hypothetical protein